MLFSCLFLDIFLIVSLNPICRVCLASICSSVLQTDPRDSSPPELFLLKLKFHPSINWRKNQFQVLISVPGSILGSRNRRGRGRQTQAQGWMFQVWLTLTVASGVCVCKSVWWFTDLHLGSWSFNWMSADLCCSHVVLGSARLARLVWDQLCWMWTSTKPSITVCRRPAGPGMFQNFNGHLLEQRKGGRRESRWKEHQKKERKGLWPAAAATRSSADWNHQPSD